jgi:hypothetical protein
MTLLTRPLITLEVEVGTLVHVDTNPNGRRFIPITGGRVEGSLSGKVLPGADWQTSWPDGRLEIDAHYALEIDGHGIVEVSSQGVRHGPPEILAALAKGGPVDASLYYFRTSMRFRTAAPGLQHLNAMLAIAKGAREKGVVRLTVFEIC